VSAQEPGAAARPCDNRRPHSTLRRLRRLPRGRHFGATEYDAPKPIRLVRYDWSRDGDLGLTCDHEGPHCAAWRERSAS
jgi:hypothetical protein